MLKRSAENMSDELIPRIGVGVVIRRGREVILMRRHNVHGSGTWSTPGGYLEFGESPEECATREAMEETGVKISNPRLLALTNDYFPEKEKHFITIWMTSDWISGEPSCTAPEESTEVSWFDYEHLPEPLFLCLENLIQIGAHPKGHWFLD